jgi:hypothetical protein
MKAAAGQVGVYDSVAEFYDSHAREALAQAICDSDAAQGLSKSEASLIRRACWKVASSRDQARTPIVSLAAAIVSRSGEEVVGGPAGYILLSLNSAGGVREDVALRDWASGAAG